MDQSKILIIGAKGQLGLALKAQYPEAQTVDIDELDITDKKSVESYDWSNVDIVLNAAAYTNVDGAETAEGRVAAWKVNATAVKNLTYAVWQHQLSAVVHISTDFVFDGSKKEHTEDEPFSPLSVYGDSKAAGDLLVSQVDKHYILRTSWVIGDGKNFVRIMLGLGQKLDELGVIDDHLGRPTFTSELVRAIDHLLTNNAEFGTYNISNSGDPVSWAGWTRQIFADAGYDCKVNNITNEQYYSDKPGSAPRPLSSTLSLEKIHATGFESRDWKDDLKDYIKKELAK